MGILCYFYCHKYLISTFLFLNRNCNASIDFEDPTRGVKIVGGVNAYIEEVPYQLSMRIATINDTGTFWAHTCGAIIISQSAVMTAAHCVYGRMNRKYSVRAGSDMKSQGGQLVDVKKIEMHPEYLPSGFYYDIAMMKLSSNLMFNTRVWSVALPPMGYKVPDGADLLVSGWGTLEFRGNSPDRLQKVIVPAVSNEECAKAYGNIREHKICAGIVGKDACQGGPLVHKNTLVGVVSSGNGCGFEGYPGIYTRVSEFLTFVVKHL
ncbi:unnamed protein product [Diamesa hyperborea]